MTKCNSLFEQLGKTTNQNNPLLQRCIDDTSIDFIYGIKSCNYYIETKK